jgi:hypothetical protein
MAWTPPVRNTTGIQFEALRGLVDKKFNDVHDELTKCYYDGTPFRTLGVLNKEQFDRLHGLIFHLRDVAFHVRNLLQLPAKRVPASEYNEIRNDAGVLTGTVSEKAAARIAELKASGIELVI